jgi:lysophospholipase L1-like esterase
MKMLPAVLALLLFSRSSCAASELPLKGETLLVIGECHMAIRGVLISYLPDLLVGQGAKVFSYGAWGAKPSAWLKTEPVPHSAFRIDDGGVRERPSDIARTQPVGELIDKHKPDLVVLIFGDTMESRGSKTMPKSWIWQEVTALTRVIKEKGTRCVWVGPPWGEEGGRTHKTNAQLQEFSDYLSTIVAPCIYVDSLTFSKKGEWLTHDGEHFNAAGYENWAKGISDAISSPEVLQMLKK